VPSIDWLTVSRSVAEVNKIIRELWTATYKGEDITNIEIMTSMDAGSKAAKSYNYRVVMTKVRWLLLVEPLNPPFHS
jgi:hypothetical protein